MTTPTIPTEGDLGFSYELQIDVDKDFSDVSPTGVPDWYQLAFITNVDDPNDKTMQDKATYKNKGAVAQTITGESWSLTFAHQMQRTTGGLFIPTLAILVEASKFGKRNKKGQVHVRWYDTEGANYAFEGVGYVTRARQNTGNADIGGFNFTITGDGAATAITNPYTQPFIVSADPASQGAGDWVTIRGLGFTGATTVKFGAVVAANFTVVDDSTIVAELDTGSAGAANVTVTSPLGTTAAFPYTRTV